MKGLKYKRLIVPFRMTLKSSQPLSKQLQMISYRIRYDIRSFFLIMKMR